MNLWLQKLLPHHLSSTLVGKLMHSQVPWLKNLLIKDFVQRYNVNMQLAEESNFRNYPSFSAFFTRKLKSGTRPIAEGASTLCSPVDGALSQFGTISGGKLIQAKGIEYSLDSLLADAELAQQFINGEFATIYLAPYDYHRVHMPLAGKLRQMRYIPGDLYSVNEYTAGALPELFLKNERVVTVYDTEFGQVALILVGAFLVGSMATSWAGQITPPHANKGYVRDYAATGPHALTLAKGQEMGYFNMGSTVIMCFESNRLQWDESLTFGQKVLLGRPLGTLS